jgi:anti-sigma regulatory factor (Ser/Thr protein kinase)
MAGLEAGEGELARFLERHPLPPRPRYHVELAFDELAGNIVRHACATGPIDVAIEFGEEQMVLTFEDDGAPFDPRPRATALAPEALNEVRLGHGGLGLPLVSRIASSLHYERTGEDRNRLTLTISMR